MIVPRYYEDLTVLHQNTMPDRAYYIPSSARISGPAWQREQSDRLQVLSGCDWYFRYYPDIHDLQEAFYRPDYQPDGSWNMEEVPFCWQMRGYDSPQYTNIRFPFPFDPPYVPQENPCGAYLHRFEWHPEKDAPAAFLNFEGVDSCFYVWLNGAYVGYSQISHHTAEFDVTGFLREGENLLAVLVLKWCDGSYLEDQDKFRFSGIFRDVYLLSRPSEHIEDYVIETDLAPDFTRADLRIRFAFSGDMVPVKLTLESVDGKKILYQKTVIPKPGEEVVIPVEDPVLWNAEAPNLYTLVMDTGREVITEQVGLRKVEVKDLVLTLNGSSITFRGINRHESDPVTGAVCTLEQALTDLRMIKANNFNAIRASHYPNVPWFYQLCDAMGFYVIDEADNESHGTGPLSFQEEDYCERMRKAHVRIADNPDFIEPTLDRVRAMVIANRNRPCILVWSMGNECGYGCTFENALHWTKETDPSRLTHYESAFYASRDREYDTSDIDLYGRMYPAFSEVTDYLESAPEIPLLLVEYCHSMGNGPGDFKEYRDLIEKYPALCGGFVWEWCDHAVYKGKDAKGKDMYWYGGDHGELQHDGNFCLDGLVYPDRTPHTGLLEFKNVHRPLRGSYDLENRKLAITNYLDFTDPEGKIEARWAVTLDGEKSAGGAFLLPSIAPHETAQIPLDVPAFNRGRCFLTVTYVLKEACGDLPAGHEFGFDEIRIPTGSPRALEAAALLDGPSDGGPVRLTEEERLLTLEGDQFTYQFDRLSGRFVSLRVRGRELLDRPVDFNLWRAPTDNDTPVTGLWKLERLDHTVTRAYEANVTDQPDEGTAGPVSISVCQSVAAMSNQPALRMKNRITVFPDGRILLDIRAAKDPEIDTLPRIGLRLFLKEEMDQVSYFGMGPGETYIDKHHSGRHGYFESDVSSLHEDYIRPQENGSHFDCDYVSVRGGGLGLSAACADEDPDRSFSFNASVFTQEELETKPHNYELEPCGSTVLCIDHQMAGIGSKSCGPDLLPQYRVCSDDFHFAFVLKPELL